MGQLDLSAVWIVAAALSWFIHVGLFGAEWLGALVCVWLQPSLIEVQPEAKETLRGVEG